MSHGKPLRPPSSCSNLRALVRSRTAQGGSRASLSRGVARTQQRALMTSASARYVIHTLGPNSSSFNYAHLVAGSAGSTLHSRSCGHAWVITTDRRRTPKRIVFLDDNVASELRHSLPPFRSAPFVHRRTDRCYLRRRPGGSGVAVWSRVKSTTNRSPSNSATFPTRSGRPK